MVCHSLSMGAIDPLTPARQAGKMRKLVSRPARSVEVVFRHALHSVPEFRKGLGNRFKGNPSKPQP